MADYVTSDLVASFGHESGALASPDAFDTLVTGASRLFDRLCEVEDDFFAPAGDEESDKDFIGDGTAYLKLLPYTTLNAVDPVLINEGTIDDPDFVATNIPLYVARNGLLVVLDRTQRMSDGTYFNGVNRFTGWPDGVEIRVSAKWGFAAVPSDVQLACIHLCYQLWRRADPTFSAISGVEGNQASITFQVPPVAQAIIDKYREKYTQQPVFV